MAQSPLAKGESAAADPLGAPDSSHPEALAHDWFLPVILCEGTVGASLDSVLAELRARARFTEAVKARLWDEVAAASGIDTITDLGQRLKLLENTLRFRLGILRPDRPSAWFREPLATSTGPFQTTLLSQAVLPPYDAERLPAVRDGLRRCWQEAAVTNWPWPSWSPSLWSILLEHRERYERIARLDLEPVGLRLDELPEGLPHQLESRALRAFLLNVRTELSNLKYRLEACFELLWAASAKLWAVQESQMAARTKPESGRSKRAGGVEDVRAAMKERRETTRRPILTPADLSALRFMGFRELPTPELLRQRYLELAKKFHPDRHSGRDEAFKTLVSAYGRLSERLPSAEP